MFKRLCVAATLSGLALCGIARADDLTDIRASGKAFAQALHDGDAATAKHYAVSDPTTDKALEVMADLTKARKTLMDASVAKFGDEGKDVVVGGASAARTEAVQTDFQNAKIEVHGDEAYVTNKEGTDSRPTYFKKVAGTWKIELAKLANFSSITRSAASVHMIADAYTATAGEIKDGKYKTVQDAKMGLRQNIAAAARSAAGARRGN